MYIPRVHGTMEPRGFAFVRFIERKDAEEAMREMEGRDIDGREVHIEAR